MTELFEKSTIRLRAMVLEDLSQVEVIDQLSFSAPWPKQAFHYELTQNKHALCQVAEYAKTGQSAIIVGAIVVWVVLNEAHISTLAVHPSYRRRGIAQKLLISVLTLATQAGATQALLEVRASNVAAQNLYLKLGFEGVGVRKGYYQDTHEDALLMTLANLDVAQLAQWAEGG